MMVERTEVEKAVRNLVALDVLWRPLSSLDGKGKRRREKSGKDITELLDAKEEIGDRVIASVEEKEEELKARTLRQGVDEFCEKYPQYGKILTKIIDETRRAHNQYLVYSLVSGYNLSEEDYVKVMMDLGFERREASATYPHLIAMSRRLKQSGEHAKRTILVAKG